MSHYYEWKVENRNKIYENQFNCPFTRLSHWKIPIMSIKLQSASRVTRQNSNPERFRLEVMKTRRSSQLAKMMTYFRNLERSTASHEDLMHLGITVVCLPEADMLLTNEGPFRPHNSFGPVFIKEFSKWRHVSYMRALIHDKFVDYLKSMGFTGLGCIFPWHQI